MAWRNEMQAGRSFDVLIQEQEADCGLCCVAMVVNLKGQGSPTSSMVKNNLKKGEYKPSTHDRVGFASTMISAVRPEVSTHSSGTYLKSLQGVLEKWNIRSQYNGPSANVAEAISEARAGQPIICHVTWNGGGGHWVVITHAMGNSHYVLDPFHGLRINSSAQNYEGIQQNQFSPGKVDKVVYGRWTGEWLKIA